MSAASSPTAYMFNQVVMSRDGSSSSMPPRSLSRAGGYDEQTLRERARRPSMVNERVPFLQPPPSPRSRLRAKFSSSNLKEDRNDGTMRAPSYEKVLADRERGHKHSNSVDSDTASIASFGCRLADEFDRQARDQASMGMDSASRQHWLNGMFNKLSRKKSLTQSRSNGIQRSGSTASNESIEEEAPTPVRKPKPHFLDLSGYINPVPRVITINVTPRPTDAQRFANSHLTGSSSGGTERRAAAVGHQASSSVGSNATFGPNSAKAPQLLRSRRSAESLGESRRRQKQDWTVAGTAGQTPPHPRGPSGPPTSAAMQAIRSQDSWTSVGCNDSGVPTLPSWARESNRNLSISSQGSGHSSTGGVTDSFYAPLSQPQFSHHLPPRSHTPDATSALATFQSIAGRTLRPAAMARAASHDQSGSPHRPVLMQRGTSNQVHSMSSGNVPHSIVESFSGLHPGSVVPRGMGMLQAQRSHGNLREGARSPNMRRDGLPSPTVNRMQRVPHTAPRSGSVSSGTGGESSVPQTPIRTVTDLPSVLRDDDFLADALSAKLSSSPVQDATLPLRRSPPRAAARTAGYVARSAEMDTSLTSDEEDELLAGAGRYSLHSHRAAVASPTRDKNVVTPRAFNAAIARRGPHVAEIFGEAHGLSAQHAPSSPTRVSQREAVRPRASTVSSSVSRNNSGSARTRKPLTEADRYADADEEVSRISYLSQGSNASSASAASSTSSTGLPPSPGRRNASTKAEEWGSSIGRKFARRGTNGKPPKLPFEEDEGTLPYVDA